MQINYSGKFIFLDYHSETMKYFIILSSLMLASSTFWIFYETVDNFCQKCFIPKKSYSLFMSSLT